MTSRTVVGIVLIALVMGLFQGVAVFVGVRLAMPALAVQSLLVRDVRLNAEHDAHADVDRAGRERKVKALELNATSVENRIEALEARKP